MLRYPLKTFLLILIVAISNALVLGEAVAHDIDPDHDTQDCSVCLCIQLVDDTPPDPAIRLDAPRFYYVAAERQIIWLQTHDVRQSCIRARAPPYS